MSKSKKDYYINNFSHIYIEKGIAAHTLTKQIVNRFPRAVIIEIEHYKDVFNRPKQNFAVQKKSQNLILAEKTDTLIYPGAEVCHDFDNRNFYYTSSILNCIYNCDYCYLQGMFSSANIVVFVNIEDFFLEVDTILKKFPVFLAVSYDTDLLAFENIVPFASMWIEYAKTKPDLLIEIRTKSINYPAIKKLPPSDNIILAWTLSPDEIIEKYERGTPSMDARSKAINEAINDGWRVRISFDPNLHIENWQEHYQTFIDKVFSVVPANKIADVSIGVFRMPKDYLKNIRKSRNNSSLLYYPYEITDGVYSYPEHISKKLIEEIYLMVNKYVPPAKIDLLDNIIKETR